ncbi:MAG: hypothetical protein N3B16_04100 [Candidatus Aminicenantes bacterium]|nr:hypothetical protein [Candidatus Aminicenantes bacterium]
MTIALAATFFMITLSNFLWPGEYDHLLFLQVFDKDKFVETLTSADLAIKVNGQESKISGVTLVKGLKVIRSEGEKIPSPIIPRVIIIEFKANDYDQKLGRIIELLFLRPYTSEDIISIVTSVKPYGFSSNTLKNYSPDELINAGITILKRDISAMGRSYNEITQEMTRLVLELPQATSPRDVLTHYKQNLQNLKAFRSFNQTTLRRATEHFANIKGLKHYIVIYQQEFLPIPNAETMERLLSNPNTMFQASELFRSVETLEEPDLDLLIQELIDARIRVDFLYFRTNPRPRPEIQLKELSQDMYELYSRVARSTGGMVETTNQPSAQLEKILKNSESYYLIAYSPPSDLIGIDQTESEIKVKIKGKDYSLNFFQLRF